MAASNNIIDPFVVYDAVVDKYPDVYGELSVIDFSNLALEVFKALQSFNYAVTLFDADGNSVMEPKDARRFFSKAADLMIDISDEAENSTLKVTHSNSVQITEILGFVETLRSICNKFNVLIELGEYNGVIKPRTFAGASLGESRKDNMDLTEHMYGTSRSSYLKLENARLIVKHSQKVDETVAGARSRQIDRMYVENKRGERLLLPTKNLHAGKAMAQHVSHGGEMDDDTGKMLCEMARDYHNLGEAIRHIRKNRSSLNESADEMKDRAKEGRGKIRALFEKLHRSYFSGIQSIGTPTLYEDGDENWQKARQNVREALCHDECDLDESVVESMARCSFDFEKEPLEEKAPEISIVDVDGTNVSRDAFLNFAENSVLDFKGRVDSTRLQDVNFRDDNAVARALDTFAPMVKDDGMCNLLAKISDDLDAGQVTKLGRQIACRAIKIARDKAQDRELQNSVMKEHFAWLESFAPENVLLPEDAMIDRHKDQDEDDDKDDEELDRSDILMPKSSSLDLAREVVKKKVPNPINHSGPLFDEDK